MDSSLGSLPTMPRILGGAVAGVRLVGGLVRAGKRVLRRLDRLGCFLAVRVMEGFSNWARRL